MDHIFHEVSRCFKDKEKTLSFLNVRWVNLLLIALQPFKVQDANKDGFLLRDELKFNFKVV